MSAKTFTAEDAQAANIVLVGAEKGRQAVHDLVTAYRANRRTGSASTKTRGEVSGNNKKIYRQKGTGNARHGDKRAPIFVGGGVVFGPRPRDYSKKVNKTTRRLALRRVLGDLTSAGKILTVDSFSVADGKTKSFIATVSAMTPPAKILIVSDTFDETTYLAGRNVSWVQLVTASDVNIEQLLLAKSVILVGDALTTLANRTA
ncbi:MAG: 50S ribosomal protein L4 [Akkermansiaceae bacterium]|nr:50S ribosomal protein L4 [Akkermansiaceae bacterium]MCF7730911.1 50S ribosomal protein L4 [Akkermansiaceae bacterium]